MKEEMKLEEKRILEALEEEGTNLVYIRSYITRDFSISSECKCLILFLLSYQYNRKNYAFSLTQIFYLINRRISNHKVIKMLNEAIEARYMIKHIEPDDFYYLISDMPMNETQN